MSRRRKRAPVKTLGWSADLAGLFDHVPESWTPPASVRAHPARGHTTLVARFATPSGHVSTAKVRISRADRDHVWVHEASLSIGFKLGGHF